MERLRDELQVLKERSDRLSEVQAKASREHAERLKHFRVEVLETQAAFALQDGRDTSRRLQELSDRADKLDSDILGVRTGLTQANDDSRVVRAAHVATRQELALLKGELVSVVASRSADAHSAEGVSKQELADGLGELRQQLVGMVESSRGHLNGATHCAGAVSTQELAEGIGELRQQMAELAERSKRCQLNGLSKRLDSQTPLTSPRSPRRVLRAELQLRRHSDGEASPGRPTPADGEASPRTPTPAEDGAEEDDEDIHAAEELFMEFYGRHSAPLTLQLTAMQGQLSRLSERVDDRLARVSGTEATARQAADDGEFAKEECRILRQELTFLEERVSSLSAGSSGMHGTLGAHGARPKSAGQTGARADHGPAEAELSTPPLALARLQARIEVIEAELARLYGDLSSGEEDGGEGEEAEARRGPGRPASPAAQQPRGPLVDY